jgi:hypothetical protein
MRPGNLHSEVAIYRYVTEGSFDAYMWQALETKARFIAQVMSGESTVRQAEDIGNVELSYAQVKAIASGNPAVLTLAEADAELARLRILHKQHADEQYLARRHVRALPATIARLAQRLAALRQDMTTAAAHAEGPLLSRWRVAGLAHVHAPRTGRTIPGTTPLWGFRHPTDALVTPGPRNTHLLCRSGSGRTAGSAHRQSRPRRGGVARAASGRIAPSIRGRLEGPGRWLSRRPGDGHDGGDRPATRSTRPRACGHERLARCRGRIKERHA